MVITNLNTNINFHEIQVFDNSDCDNFRFTNSKNLKILYFNARSIKSGEKLSEIDNFLNDLKCKIHVIVISETWVKDEEKGFYNIPNYMSNYSCRTNRNGGGIGIFVHKSLNFKILKNYSDDDINYMTIETLFENCSMRITGFYRPPSFSIDTIAHFERIFEDVMSSNRSLNSLIFGDFNINLLNHTSNMTNDYLSLLNSFGYFVCDPNTITRPSSGTVIDHVLSNNFLLKANISHFPNYISDHRFIIYEHLNMHVPTTHEPNTITFQKLNLNDLKDHLSENVFIEPIGADIDILYDSFINYFTECCNYCSVNITKRKKKEIYIREWIDDEIIALVRSKRFWHKKLLDNQENELIETEYKLVLNQLTAARRIKKFRFYERKFGDGREGPKETWKNIKLALHDGVLPKEKEITITDTDGKILKGKENSDALNSHFVSIAANVTSNLHSSLGCSTNSENIEDNFIFIPTDEAEVREVINSLKKTSSAGVDKIKLSTLKFCIDETCTYIVNIINLSFTQNKVPKGMKIAKIIPIFKGGSPTDPSNYRPISILPILSKILEKIVQNRLLNFFQSRFQLFNRQYGFIQNSNTICALFDLVAKVQSSLDSKFRTSGLFLDLAKAFDVVNHEFLLTKLLALGIRNDSNQWFRSYLSNRFQFVFCNSVFSELLLNSKGVPQGSILGPLLFLLFIDDLKELILKGNLQLFADDIAIVYSEKNWADVEQAMNQDLEEIRNWMSRNKLAVNIRKSNFIIFGNTETPDLNIHFGDESLNLVFKVKYLGVWIDSRLNFVDHIDFLRKKCSAIIGILFKLKNILPFSVKKVIYYSLVHSHFSYACEIWGHTFDEHLKKIVSTQKRAIKAMCGVSFRTPSFPIFCQNLILPIRHLIKYQSCIHIHNSLNSYINTDIPLMINAQYHDHDTRRRRNLHFDNNNSTRHGSSSVLHCSKKYYNDHNLVPNEFKTLNKNTFKIKLKTFFRSSFLNNLN
jgi:hypothetical protein